MSQSLKFKILFECAEHKNLKDYILPFWYASELNSLPSEYQTFILRSALKSENQKSLNSGVGRSICDIKTDKEFQKYRELLASQDDLDFLIIQPYFNFQKHLTIFKTQDFVFVEVQAKNTSEFFFFNKLTSSKLPIWMKTLQNFIDKFEAIYSGEFLIEAGLKEKQMKVFQINELTQNHIKDALYSEVLSKSLAANQYVNTNSLWQKIKLEYRAHVFRNKKSYTHFSDTFNNWLFIFFYFKAFCTTNKLEFSAYSFQSFLSSASDNTIISKNLKRHLEISSLTNKASDWNIESGFKSTSEIFIGSGFKEGVVDQSVLVCKDLTMDMVLKTKPKVILTSYNSLLSHPILYSAENGILLVGGLSNSQIDNISVGDKFSLDFKSKQIIIESK